MKDFGKLDNKGNYKGSSRSGYKILPETHEGVEECPLEFMDILESCFWKLSFYQPEDFVWQTTSFQPVGGMDMIVKALTREVEKMGGKIILNAPVQKIDRSSNGWTINYGENQVLEAKTCVSNIPIPLLNGKVKEEDFSENYWKALDKVMNTKNFLQPTCKVGWQSDRSYWQNPKDENTIPIFGGISRVYPNKMEQMWYPSNDYHDNTGILTGAYNHDENAEDWGKILPSDRIKKARDGAETLHGSEFSKQLRHGISIAWQNIEYQEGGWVEWHQVNRNSSFKEHAEIAKEFVATQPKPTKTIIGSATWCYNELQKEDNGFFITGDQMSQLPGWQEGAMASALQIYGLMMHPEHIEPLNLYRVPNTRILVQGR